MEKIHGTSAHISFKNNTIHYFSGGESHVNFVKLFDEEKLKAEFANLGHSEEITVFGEAYGGKCQGMSATYGKELKFVAFDVQVGENWLNVPNAEDVCKKLGLEFVHYAKCSTDLVALDAARDADSVQAVRNGIGPGKKMEGVILRPLVEMKLNNSSRVICKHKRDEFKETATPRPIVDPSQLQILNDAQMAADEWVTANRLQHVLDKIPNHSMEKMRDILQAMKEDVYIEGEGEIVPSPALEKAISTKTVQMYKNLLKSQLAA